MPVVRRSRTIDASADRVWAMVSDPHQMPRWWPEVIRMEGIEEDRFTQVFTTRKGRSVRMDFRRTEEEPPVSDPANPAPGRAVWEQELAGSPFERVFGESVTEIVVEPSGRQARVMIAHRQQLRGYSRTGGFMLRRATRARLDAALAGLADAVTG